ncbi:hypothetical protein CONLIGDRAFT_642790 [Coniochaeta ligniaria NRRL 30616]|uniref:Uncharacterized protein n=1 Tax=Coniochaeta ligniaria NRRL 30616 TaxID=1408157 RepID=A0A1J7JBQ3_9PEZI|nr:hypothetical protein CONLIGDRAFT_642790 [Coniochaeta ligniaria NRRL 30616]
MSFYPDAWENLRANRERRARERGEYSYGSYADSGSYSGHARSSPSYETEDTDSNTPGYNSYAEYRSGRRSPPLSDYERASFRTPPQYDEPPTPRPQRRTGRRSSFTKKSYSRSSGDDPAFSDAYDSEEDPLKARSRRRPAYTRSPPSPPPPPRGGYDFDDDLRSGSPRVALRFVAAEMIEELDDDDPRGMNKPKAPYLYVGTEDPDGTIVDDPFEDGRRGGETPRRPRRSGSASHGDEQYDPRGSESGRYDDDPSGSSSGSYSGSSYSSSYSGTGSSGGYSGFAYGASYGSTYGGYSGFAYGASSGGYPGGYYAYRSGPYGASF